MKRNHDHFVGGLATQFNLSSDSVLKKAVIKSKQIFILCAVQKSEDAGGREPTSLEQ